MSLQSLKMPEDITSSLAHEISTTFEVDPSTANAILMPYVLDYNRKATDKIEAIEKILNIESLSEAYQQINTTMGVPLTFENVMEVEITEQRFLAAVDAMSANVAADPCTARNPRKVSESDIRKIYECAYYGNSALRI